MIDGVYHRTAVVIQHLQYLVALARERHFGRAAASCHVSQPTLSAGIQRLELELGAPLVRRGRRFEGLTAEGELILERAQRILSDVEGLPGDLGSLRGQLEGRLRLGAVPTSLAAVGLLCVPLHELHPRVQIQVFSLNSREIAQKLHDFELDCGLTYLDSEPIAGVRTLPLYAERYLLLCSAESPLAARRSVTWQDAASLDLCLLTPDMQNRRIIDAAFARVGIVPRPVVETNSVATIFPLVGDGRIASVVAHSWLHLFGVGAGLRTVPLVDPVETRTIGLVWPDRDPESRVARALCDVAGALDLQGALETG